ncbi:hypothetical protein ACFX1Q_046599 [Malus domestica]
MGLRRSMRQNATRRGAASSPRASTMGTTVMATSVATRGEVHGAFTTAAMGTTTVATSVAARGEVHGAFTTAAMGTTTVATSVATRGEVHGAFTTARVVPSKFTWTKAQASHSHTPRIEQPAPVIQPALVAQPAPTIQPAPVIQLAPAAQPVFMVSQAAQVRPRQSQPSGPIIEAEAFSPHFSADLTFPNSNLALGVNHPFIVQGGAFHPSSSNPNGEQNLSRQVIELTSALAQQTTLVNQLLQRTEMHRAHDEVSRSRTRVDNEPFKQRPGKQPFNPSQVEHSDSAHSRLGPRNSVYSRLSARRSVHSRLGPRASIHSRLGPRFDNQHGQPSRQSIHSRLGSQGVSSTSHRSRQPDKRKETIVQSGSSSTGSLQKNPSPARNLSHPLQPQRRRAEREEEQPRPVEKDQGQPKAPLPQQKQIQEEVERLFNERMRDFRRNEMVDEALRRDMTNMSRSPFADEIEQAEPPRKFSMPHFTSFKGDGDPERHLKHYRNAMVLYRNNDALMCKIFATTLQGEAQDWFHTLPARSIQNFDDLSLVFTKEYSSYRSIKKKSDHLFNVKKNPKESLRDYVKRFKAEKAKIVGCDNSIASAAFQKGLPADHPLFGEMIMKEDLTLADSFALAEKHALWDEARQAEKAPEQPRKELATAQKKDEKQPNKGRQEFKRRDRPTTKEGPMTNNYSKFSIPIHQILRDVKNEPWFKLPRQSKGDTSKLDHTKYCAFHRGPGHTTNDCYTWKNYLEKLVKEGKVDRYLDKPAEQPKRNADGDEEPPTKTIRINGIFAESEHLGATNNSKKRKIQQALLISQVHAVDTQPGPIIGFTDQDAEGVDFPHDDALVVSVQLAHAIVDRMMVDNGSAVNLLQLSVIQKMGLESTIIRRAEVLTGFNGHTSTAIGHIILDVKTPPVVSKQTFTIVSDPSPYNGILGRPWLIKLDAVTSVKYQKIRFRIPGGGVGEIKSDQASSRRCTVQMLKETKKKTFTPVKVTEVQKGKEIAK